MGKKDKVLMAKQSDLFMQGAKGKGIDAKTANTLFERIEQFAGYGFNKSHSMAYAYVAYQTAYLKANYPVEFMAALLTSETGNLDKVGEYIEECRQMNVGVLPPDVNKSYTGFTVEGNAIRFGMGAVKNVGEGLTDAIVNERDANGPFKDIFDFCRRLDTRGVNRRVIESLNKAGAFCSTGWNRRQVEAVIDVAMNEGQIAQRDRESGQTSLFDLMDTAEAAATLHNKPDVEEWPENEILAFEKEMLGLYVSSHPLARHATILERYSTIHIADIPSLREGQEVVIGGLIANAKHYVTAKGSKMAFITVETLEGPCEITVFADVFEQRAGLLVQDMVVMVPARVSFRNNTAGLVASDVIPVEEAETQLTRSVHIRLQTLGLDEGLVARLAQLLGDAPGRCDVLLHCITPENTEITVQATPVCRVAPTRALREGVEQLLGKDTVWFAGRNHATPPD
jgi:DNA polymerase-3 subunit alpha